MNEKKCFCFVYGLCLKRTRWIALAVVSSCSLRENKMVVGIDFLIRVPFCVARFHTLLQLAAVKIRSDTPSETCLLMYSKMLFLLLAVQTAGARSRFELQTLFCYGQYEKASSAS